MTECSVRKLHCLLIAFHDINIVLIRPILAVFNIVDHVVVEISCYDARDVEVAFGIARQIQ